MTLALKAFKHHPSLSEETMAFDAIVTWHGRPIYHARNDGRGGMTRLRPVSEGDSEDRSAAQRANASREREYLQHTPDVIVQLGPDLEDWVDSLAGREVEITRVQRVIKRCAAKAESTFALLPDGLVTEFNAPPSHPGIPAVLEKAGATNLMTLAPRAAATLVVDTQHASEQVRLKAAYADAAAPLYNPSSV